MGQVRRCLDLCYQKNYDHTRERRNAHDTNRPIDSELALHT